MFVLVIHSGTAVFVDGEDVYAIRIAVDQCEDGYATDASA